MSQSIRIAFRIAFRNVFRKWDISLAIFGPIGGGRTAMRR